MPLASPRARRCTARAAVGLATLLVLTGCGGSEGSEGAEESDRAEIATQTEVDDVTQACRDDWQELGEQVEAELGDAAPTPSVLRTRWVTVEAQIAYYSTSATSDDCESRLRDEQATIDALSSFSESLRPYDIEARLAGYERDLTAYARPAGRAGRAAPSVAQVRSALADLRRLAPQATAQQSAAWQQAAVVDLEDEQARKRATRDLEVVSGESAAYRDATAAARVLARAVTATGD